MIDFIFDSIQAYNALGFLLGALILMLIGTGCFGYWLYWRIASIRVKGRIVGIKSTGQRKSEDEWRKQYEANELSAKVEPSWDEIKEDVSEDFKEKPFTSIVSGFFIMLFVLMPFAFFTVGAWFAYDFLNLRMTGVKAAATVVSYETTYDSDNGTMYYPVLAYKDHNDKEYREKDRLGTGDKPYSTGARVSVFYEREEPDHFVIDSFWRYMLFSLAFMGISGVFIVFMAVGLIRNLRGYEPPDLSKPEKKSVDRLKSQHYMNQQYVPVYEFKTPNGEIVQMDGVDDASNWIVDKLPGKNVTLMMITGKNRKVKRPGKLFLFLGVLFFAPGILFLNLALPLLELNLASISIFLGLFGFIAYKAYKGLSKAQIELPRWDEFKEEGGSFDIEAKVGSTYLLSASEIQERVRIIDKNAVLGVIIMLMASVGMMFGGYHLYQDMSKFSGVALLTQGKVVAMESSSTSDGFVYYPVVSYITYEGEQVQFRTKVGSNPPSRKVGDRVAVLFDPNKPERARIDSGFINWLPSIGLMFFGFIILYHSLKTSLGIARRSIFGPRRHVI